MGKRIVKRGIVFVLMYALIFGTGLVLAVNANEAPPIVEITNSEDLTAGDEGNGKIISSSTENEPPQTPQLPPSEETTEEPTPSEEPGESTTEESPSMPSDVEDPAPSDELQTDAMAQADTFGMGVMALDYTVILQEHAGSSNFISIPLDALFTSYTLPTVADIGSYIPSWDTTNKRFAGWYDALNNSYTTVDESYFLSSGFNTVTLYAKWTVDVTVYLNGGQWLEPTWGVGVTQKTYTLEYGSTLSTASNPSAWPNPSVYQAPYHLSGSQYPFSHWETVSPRQEFRPYETVVTAHTSIYAKWNSTVVYHQNLPSGFLPSGTSRKNDYADTSVIKDENKAVLDIRNPVFDGWWPGISGQVNFAGWSLSSDGSSGFIDGYGGGVISSAVGEDGNGQIHVYAQWRVTVTADLNGGTWSSGTQFTIPYGQSLAGNSPAIWPSANPTKTSYTFNEWRLWGSNSGYNLSGNVYANTTIVANWNPTVTYVQNIPEGNGFRAMQSAQYGFGSYNAKILTVGNIESSTGNTWWPNGNVRLEGWNTKPDGSGDWYVAGRNYNFTASVVLYAQWRVDVTINLNGGTWPANSNWPQSSSQEVYTLRYGQSLSSHPLFTANAPQHALYNSFYRWENGNLGSAFNTSAAVTSHVSIYAQWQSSITYHKNDGTATQYTHATAYPVGRTMNILTRAANSNINWARPGYTFAYWTTEPDGSGLRIADGASYLLTSKNNLYAQWAPTATVVVSYNGNGVANPQSTSLYHGQNFNDANKSLPAPTRPGYTFNGWFLPGASTAFSQSDVVTGNLTLTAKWTYDANQWATVRFYPENGNSNVYYSLRVIKGTTFSGKFPVNPGYTGFYFNGWRLWNGVPFDANYVITNDTDVYAHWVRTPPVTPPPPPPQPQPAPRPKTSYTVVNKYITTTTSSSSSFSSCTEPIPVDESIPIVSESDISEVASIPFVPEDDSTPPIVGGNKMSIVNLILACLSVILSVLLVVNALARGFQGFSLLPGLPFRILAFILGFVPIIIFLLTENIFDPITFVNLYTLPIAVLFIVQLVFVFLTQRRANNTPYDDNTYYHA